MTERAERPIVSTEDILHALVEQPSLLDQIKELKDKGDNRSLTEIFNELSTPKVPTPELPFQKEMSNEEFMCDVFLRRFTQITAQSFEQGDGPYRHIVEKSLWEGVTFKREAEQIIWERGVPKGLEFLYERIDRGKIPSKHILRNILKQNFPFNTGTLPYTPKKGEWYLAVERGLVNPDDILVILNSGTDCLKEDHRGTLTSITIEAPQDVVYPLVERLLNPDKNISIDMLRRILFDKSLGIGNEYKFGNEYDSYNRKDHSIISPDGTLESINNGSYKINPSIIGA